MTNQPANHPLDFFNYYQAEQTDKYPSRSVRIKIFKFYSLLRGSYCQFLSTLALAVVSLSLLITSTKANGSLL